MLFVVHSDDCTGEGFTHCREIAVYRMAKLLYMEKKAMLTIGIVPEDYPYDITSEISKFIHSVEKYCKISPLTDINSVVIRHKNDRANPRRYIGVLLSPNSAWLVSDITMYIFSWLARVSFTTTADLFGGTELCRSRFANIDVNKDDIIIEGTLFNKMLCLMTHVNEVFGGMNKEDLYSYYAIPQSGKVDRDAFGLRAFFGISKRSTSELSKASLRFNEIYKKENERN